MIIHSASKIFVIVASGAIFLFAAKLALASPDLIISEVMYDLPGTDTNHEWVELYNAGSSEIDLTDFKFNDGSNHGINPPPLNGSRGSIVIAAGGYLILSGNASTTILDLSNYAGPIIDTVMSLNNTSDTLKILDKDGAEIASASYTKEMGGAGNGKTLSWDGIAFKESAQDGGSPGEMNTFLAQESPAPPPPPTQEEQTQTPEPEPTSSPTEPAQTPLTPPQNPYKNSSDKIFINEFLPWPPTDGKEWTELLSTDTEIIDLSGWQIDDGPEASSPQKISEGTLINPGQFLVIELNKNILNNDGDQIRLFWPDGQVAHSVAYQDVKQGFSSSRFEAGSPRLGEAGLWLWTEKPTPGQENKKPTQKTQAAPEQQNSTPTTTKNQPEQRNQTGQINPPPKTEIPTTQIPPAQQPKANPLIEATKENAAPKKSSQSATKSSSPENEATTNSKSLNFSNTHNLSAAAVSPLQNQAAQKDSSVSPLLSLAGLLILSLAASLGLIYFKHKKSVDPVKKLP